MLASRSTLALTAFTLLASGAVMAAAGAGPDLNKRADLSIHVDIGGGDHGGWGHHPRPVFIPARPVYVPAPVIVQTPVVIQRPVVIADAAPRTLDLQAYQAGDTVIIFARGENVTTGFTTTLERVIDGRYDGVANIVLRNTGPVCDYAGQACTPFSVSAGYETKERVSQVRVCVAGQDRVIPVEHIEQMRRAN